FAARARFVREWSPVAGRPTLDDVADIDIAARDSQTLFDHRGQQLPGASHERQPGSILFGAGAFSDEHQVGGRVAVSEHDLGALLAKATSLAVSEHTANGLERGPIVPTRPWLEQAQRLRSERCGSGSQNLRRLG